MNNRWGYKILILLFSSIFLIACFDSYKRVSNKGNDKIEKNQLLVVRNEESIKIISKYSQNSDLIFHYNLLGINGITHLTEILINNNDSMYPSGEIDNANIFCNINTDWISPYGLISRKNVSNSKNGFTVGGNHGTNGARGRRTAERLKVEVELDGKEVNNESRYGKSLIITTVNNISPSNSLDGPGIIETVVYTITPCNIKVDIELEAKEDVIFTRYVGLQAGLKPFSDLIMKYENGIVNKFKIQDIDDKYNFISKGISKIDKFVLEDNYNRMTCKLDKGELGCFKYVTNDNPTCYASNTKVYIHTVKGEKLELNNSEKVRYSGKYLFEYINR